jgi:tRNA/rRNA methyltransferase
MLYLLSRAGGGAGPEPAQDEPARHQTLQALEGVMERALSRAGFTNPQAPDYVLRELMQTLRRARPSQREAELWTAAFKQLERVTRPR